MSRSENHTYEYRRGTPYLVSDKALDLPPMHNEIHFGTCNVDQILVRRLDVTAKTQIVDDKTATLTVMYTSMCTP